MQSTDKVTDLFDISVPKPHIPVGGRLKWFKSQWYNLTKDPKLIEMISGCPIRISRPLPSNTSVRDIRMNSKEMSAAREHISELLAKNAVVKSNREEGDFLSNVFLCPKKDGGYRMILNLKEFNKYVDKIHFKMETLQSILHLVTPQCWQTILDLQDAYLTVPVKFAHQIFLKFTFQGQIYMYIVLPFGYTQAPRIFTKIIKPIVARLRSFGITVMFYLDDSWQAGESFNDCLQACKETFRLLTACGFIPNIKKSKLIPSQIVTVLGTVINSLNMTIYLPTEKEKAVLTLIKTCLAKHHISIRQLAQLIGKLISCTAVCPLGKLFYRNLEKVKNRFLQLNHFDWDCQCRLNDACKSELTWWLNNLPNCSAPIVRPNPQLSISFDACSYGWGCHFNGKYANGHFSPAEQIFSINTKETLAILYGLRSFKSALKGHHILLQSDNTTAVSYVKRMGGMTSDLRMNIARDIWLESVENDCWLSVSFLPGVLNTEADIASRFLNERTEWMIAPVLFKTICDNFKMKPEIDLFASRLNTHLPVYASFGPDPHCSFVDAFTFNWSQFTYCYAYPPFNLICRTLAKFRRDKPKGILICPAWPNQPWFTMMLSMCTQLPRLLPASMKCMLTLPWSLTMTHPNLSNLKLLSVALSGIDTDVKAFQQTLPSASSMDILRRLPDQTLLRPKNGIYFVNQGKLIQCIPLSIP